ncbi:hypothetical protein HYV81_00810 [Candidatus Woesearchaeota archaeon]|nr:hypothetical protein [Candidatus Woesearchaeota archaeon]
MALPHAAYEFHKWKSQLLWFDKILSILVILLLGLFRPDWLLIAVFFLIIPYLVLTERTLLLHHLVAAFFISLLWMVVAREEYAYNTAFITIAGINLYPLFSWSVGLFTLYLLYSHYEHLLHKQTLSHKLLLFTGIYWPLLIFAETTAYHLFNIRNLATAAFPGLPLCDCIHAPLWMQITYFIIGIVFFVICYALKLENPHHKIIK